MPIALRAGSASLGFEWPSPLVVEILAGFYMTCVGVPASEDAALEHEVLLRGIYYKTSTDRPFARDRLLAKLATMGIAETVVVDAELLVVRELLNLLSARFRASPPKAIQSGPAGDQALSLVAHPTIPPGRAPTPSQSWSPASRRNRSMISWRSFRLRFTQFAGRSL